MATHCELKTLRVKCWVWLRCCPEKGPLSPRNTASPGVDGRTQHLGGPLVDLSILSLQSPRVVAGDTSNPANVQTREAGG